ncbi:hypothetical protein [Antrihabitans stalactiti]|uniref:Uncharacterized protein n=1 Tax=Antrihabitans stalactiti TaxID=2584121 RepID=A0A848KLV8_9NOCA|nr:hypothetical protein [Antrihabitans stalactiti]NMN99239.1 hypothetical protein [Antrihabitans stalactiti]
MGTPNIDITYLVSIQGRQRANTYPTHCPRTKTDIAEQLQILESPKYKADKTFADIGGRPQYLDPQAAGSGFKSLMAH